MYIVPLKSHQNHLRCLFLQTLVYVSYSTRLDKGDDDNKSRYKSTTCALSGNN